MKWSFDIEALNHALRLLMRMGVKGWLETKARLTGNRFYCTALSGQSEYNICVNSDLTVTCNCRDLDGTGTIGDLNRQTMSEIFAGPVARKFRRRLAMGRLPILTCASCPELKPGTRSEAEFHETHFQPPSKGLQVENTIACNYHCASCSRKTLAAIRTQKTMSLEDIRKVSHLLREHQIKAVYFFHLGDPFSAKDVLEQLRIIRAENPTIELIVSTNGTLITSQEKREAALMLDHLTFSIDGPNTEIMAKYQRGARFDLVYENMRQLVAERDRRQQDKPVIEWKYVLFNWNDRKETIDQSIALAREAKVDMISFWPTRYPVYGISWRYYLSRHLRSLGQPSWKGRELPLSSRASTPPS